MPEEALQRCVYTGAALGTAHRTQGVYYIQGQGTGLTGLRGCATFLAVCKYAFSPHSLCLLIFGLLVRTHSSEMTTSGNKGDSSKRGAQRRGQHHGDGGAPVTEREALFWGLRP